ncbi:MAG TPA: alkaline phosphatase D family protein [Acidimicrobiales bacterium]
MVDHEGNVATQPGDEQDSTGPEENKTMVTIRTSLSRRRFLAASAAAGVAMSLGRRLPARAAGSPSFPQGLASGDPSQTGVTLWTRVASAGVETDVAWRVLNPDQTEAAAGSVTTGDSADHTVKVDVTGLEPGTAYAYEFSADGATITGSTKTLPSGSPGHFRIGLASCAKYTDGYYNAYRGLADAGCDVVVHLGDYIYESPTGPLRSHEADVETVTLDQYRARYAHYKTDPDLQALHASTPMIPTWDDHESADNAWRDGSHAHNPPADPGTWAERKAAAQRAWSEYQPVRVGAPDSNGDLQIWRSFQVGDLVDLVMLDTRLQRDQQVSNAAAESTAENDDPERTMLGSVQEAWLAAELETSRQRSAAWRMLGQGILTAHWRVSGPPEAIGAMRKQVPLVHEIEGGPSQRLADGGVYWNSDGWDGYTAARSRLFDELAKGPNNVVLTGDIHSSWANELVPGADPLNDPVGVELVTPAISTTPFASLVQGYPLTSAFEAAFIANNPWIRYVDMDANGYCILDVYDDRTEARWYQVDTSVPGASPSLLTAWVTDAGSQRLRHLDGALASL